MNDPQPPVVTIAKAAPAFAGSLLGLTAADLSYWGAFFGAASAALATLYTAGMLVNWWWKVLWRPIFESHGWVKPRKVKGYVPVDTDGVPLE